jgi:hypothetical protein
MKILLSLLIMAMTSCYSPKYYLVSLKGDPNVKVMKTKQEIKKDIHLMKKQLRDNRKPSPHL